MQSTARKKQSHAGRNSDVEKVRREKIRDGESQKREDAGGSGGSKSRLAKAPGAEPAGQVASRRGTKHISK